jgi:hypothetical protein
VKLEGTCDLCRSHCIVRTVKCRNLRWNRDITTTRRQVMHTILGIYLEKHRLGKPRRRWEDNIKMNVKI